MSLSTVLSVVGCVKSREVISAQVRAPGGAGASGVAGGGFKGSRWSPSASSTSSEMKKLDCCLCKDLMSQARIVLAQQRRTRSPAPPAEDTRAGRSRHPSIRGTRGATKSVPLEVSVLLSDPLSFQPLSSMSTRQSDFLSPMWCGGGGEEGGGRGWW